jgi:light-regulated signal transduction histidine kinase (bacteriophytochrome)
MSQLIDDILKLSKVSRSEMSIKEVDLSTIANEIAIDLQQLEEDRKVDFIIQENIIVNADKQLIQIVLENLIGNAWKFTSKQPKALIEVGKHQNKSKTVYFVRDNGAGFDMKYVEKLFGTFQRFHPENEFPGTGIGLATVKRIIHRHGGDVWAESEVEKGATFYFTLSYNYIKKNNR